MITKEEAERLQWQVAIDEAKAMTPWERVCKGFQMYEEKRDYRIMELSACYPQFSEEEIKKMVQEEFDVETREKHEIIDKYGLLP